MVLASSTSWDLLFKLGLIFIASYIGLLGPLFRETLKHIAWTSVALQNHDTRYCKPFYLAYLMPTDPVTCGQCFQLLLSSGYPGRTSSTAFMIVFVCCPWKTSSRLLLSRNMESVHHSQFRLSPFQMNLHFHKLEVFMCLVLCLGTLSHCPRAKQVVSF